MQYTRNDIAMVRGTFRVRGDVLEYVAVDDEVITRLDFFGDQLESITRINQVTGELIEELDELTIFPAKHFITPEEETPARMPDDRRGAGGIAVAFFKREGRLLEAQRIEMRTRNDLESLRASSAIATASRTTRATSPAARQARPRSACSISSRTIGCSSSTNRT